MQTAPSVKLYSECVNGTLVISLWEPGCIEGSTQFLIFCLKSRSSGGMDYCQHCQIKLLAEGSSKATIDENWTPNLGWRLIYSATKPWPYFYCEKSSHMSYCISIISFILFLRIVGRSLFDAIYKMQSSNVKKCKREHINLFLTCNNSIVNI